MANERDDRSAVLPTDPFELALSGLIGLPNGAHTAPAVVQALDFYGNLSRYIVQTVKWEEGHTVFVTLVNTNGQPAINLMLPPAVMAAIGRQQDSVSTMVRRRHGKRLAEQRAADGHRPVFTPEMRAKALATRKAKAAKRRARRARKA
jgi:hypothetical protein